MKIISVFFSALVLLYSNIETRAALPLTETIYTIPESEIEVGFREEILRTENNYRREKYSVGIGLLPYLSVWYSFEYLHDSININPSNDVLGDSFLKIWFYINDLNNTLYAGLLLSFRIPTGADAFTDHYWRNLCFGNNELKLGPVFRISFYKSLFIHFNLFYVFRQGINEDFYGGFHLNPIKKETYSKFFGLNYRSHNTFLESNRLKNDYAVYSMGINTNSVYPVIPYAELYISHRIYRKTGSVYDDIPIEGGGINPILLSLGMRYFFSELFFGIYYIYNPKREKKFIKDIFGFDFSLQF